ncbi:peptidoglycan-N-acetylglucosamine deacetylase [Azospirillaceae bacterium]
MMNKHRKLNRKLIRLFFATTIFICGLFLPSASTTADEKERSYAARNGAAPFETQHLYPGGAIVLSQRSLTRPDQRVMALTFDDGPDATHDPAIAALLKQYNAKATFFFIGNKLPNHDSLIRNLAAAGHDIGNHTLHHPMMSNQSPAEQINNLRSVNDALARIGISTHWFRPPFGDFDAITLNAAHNLGLETILWTIDSRDWKIQSANEIAARVISRFHPGAVILQHSTKAASLSALPKILAEGNRQGYRFVTLSEWKLVMSHP